ncbi:MAG TPA: sigma-70 family RNA polymerase sigma factor [Baekduia sp.]|nr:sigma-70 family RNA polymerase sigma factor [Baekduia sp.]
MGGPSDSRADLIERHLPLVRSIAGRYARRGEPLEDLVQVGTVGLIKAVDRFDPGRHPDLAALARPSIEGEIRHHLRDGGAVRVPRTDHELSARLGAVRDELAASGRHEPTLAELASAAGVGEARAARALQAVRARRAVPLPDGGGVTPARGEDEAAEARVLLEAGWSMLDARERRLLELRYREDRSQSQIARELGLSQAHVSRLLRAALEHLRDAVGPLPEAPGEEDGGPAATTREAAVASPAEHRSGRLLLRLPRSLHTELAAAADRDGVALNTFIVSRLAAAIGWQDGEEAAASGDRAEGPAPDGDAQPARLLVLNAVVIAVAALTGIALLLVALLGS